jgi:hypothetical protein
MADAELSVTELIAVARDAIRGTCDKTADFVTGSDYEALAGMGAMIWSRQQQRDTDLFRSIRYIDADGDALTDMAKARFGIDRILATRGQGTARIRRASAAGGAGAVWEGTRIRVATGAFSESKLYRVREDTAVPATATEFELPIEAVEYGKGSATDGSSTRLFFEDPLWDESWVVTRLECADGTELEEPGAFRARIDSERFDARVGFEPAIIKACKDAGASQVVVFRSDYGGDARDDGLNVVYVGDLSYTGTADMVRACTKALRSVRVGGDQMQVLPMSRSSVTVDADIYLCDNPALLPVERIESIHRGAILQYLGGTDGGFTFSRVGLQSALTHHVVEVQEVDFVAPTTDATVLVNNAFPSILTRYVITDSDIILRYHPPK